MIVHKTRVHVTNLSIGPYHQHSVHMAINPAQMCLVYSIVCAMGAFPSREWGRSQDVAAGIAINSSDRASSSRHSQYI